MAIYRGGTKIVAVNCAGIPIAFIYNGSTLIFVSAANQGSQGE